MVETAYGNFERNVLVNNVNELTLHIAGVKITFLAYPFPPIAPLVQSDAITMLSVPEIGATKAYTIGRRGELKDYVDLFSIIKGGYATLPEIIRLADRKYGDVFDARLFLEQLFYLDDVEDVPMIRLGYTVERDELTTFFTEAIATVRL